MPVNVVAQWRCRLRFAPSPQPLAPLPTTPVRRGCRRSQAMLLAGLLGWVVFLLPFGVGVLATYAPRAVVGEQRADGARRLGAGWFVSSAPLAR
jgi:hypothetical protein